MIKRRTVLAGGGAAAVAAMTAAAAEPETTLAAAIIDDGQTIKVVHVTAGNGTDIADLALPADHSPYPLFKQFLTHKASATAIYSAPPRHRIATAADAKYLLFIAAGETILRSGDQAAGPNRRCGAGTFILTEPGAIYTEHAGADGYTAIKVKLAD